MPVKMVPIETKDFYGDFSRDFVIAFLDAAQQARFEIRIEFASDKYVTMKLWTGSRKFFRKE